MRSALFLPLFDELADPLVVARLAAEGEGAGWDGLFVWDHTAYWPPVREVADPWITLAAIACATERIRLGPMVTPLPRRRPVKVAREVATLDALARGRLTLGVGIGVDTGRELSATGEQLDARVRGAMLDEALDVLTAAWSGAEVNHRGEHYQVDGMTLLPTPIQRPRPPVWVALRRGNTAPLRRAARFEGIFPIEVETPDQLAEIIAAVASLRAPGAGPFDVAVGGPPGVDPAPYAAAGATWWMVSVPAVDLRLEAVRGLAREGPALSS